MNKFLFFNKNVNKNFFNSFLKKFLFNFGEINTINLLDSIKNLGFKFATKGGISLSIQEFKVPNLRNKLINDSFFKLNQEKINLNENCYNYLSKTYQVWNNVNCLLRKKIIDFFVNQDKFNNLFMISTSGARGNLSQIYQMIGMRGLMSDNKGDIITEPILSNFKEGLKISEYLISSFGARKGIVDTALRTADSGYLTRRLVECCYNVAIRGLNCRSKRFIDYSNLSDLILSYDDHFIYRNIFSNEINFNKKNKVFSIDFLRKKINTNIFVYSPLSCQYKQSICQHCYGYRSIKKKVELGKPVGILAGQSLGEPATQMTMRTFHTGGVSSNSEYDSNTTNISGFLKLKNLTYNFSFINLINFNNKEINILIKNEDFLYSKNFLKRIKNFFLKKGTNVSELKLFNFDSSTYEYCSFKLLFSEFSGQVFNLENKNYNKDMFDNLVLISSNQYIKILPILISKIRFAVDNLNKKKFLLFIKNYRNFIWTKLIKLIKINRVIETKIEVITILNKFK